ncbi:MAG: class II aldolase/adducin family protein [Betaproteobacteria bacterium]|jgi:ribulose-5-phosphate 4-epimerase/fuculose-1-phosphate aldolase|nr:class II aldolase/adducin family protein [Pseudomonadota bacterium]NBP35057.1 class II aldolase/adducin family protein [Betaproteobacteria bacterium]NBP37108.1 class II aldolase/adducin family protein [Betaproteobacteria bacterium]NBQ95058.1 class II aldolase/adducin family protein [Betaproteobacteria bacterium]NBS37703.1 class II aldolase/adducin family protein [Betaproteobacteria bacterium]
MRLACSEVEWQLRCDLAACYRLIALHGWDDLVFTHISARIPETDHHFLINPYGMMFEEITASSLVKVDMAGQAVTPSAYPVNPAGFVIHSAIHAARDDVICVLHTHSTAGVAVAAQAQGLLPISQQASVVLAGLAYHDYEGLAVRDDEKKRLQANLGSKQALMLRNHGLLTVGTSIAAAYLAMFTLERACQIQLAAQAGGAELLTIRRHILEGTAQAVSKATAGMDASVLVWPALLRRLNRLNPGYDQ